jgi:uncharacterized protein (TIGR01777 family)
MRVLISGSTGFIGSHLVSALRAEGHEVLRLVRSEIAASEQQVRWNAEDDFIEREALAGVDAVVHLAGENIFGRWTEAKMRAIRQSRVRTTAFLAEVLASLPVPPTTFLSASAVGFYGDRGDEVVNEESAPGEGFLAQVCREWEEAAAPAAQRGIRVAHMRFGVVLAPDGGALGKMLMPFKLGLGGPIGSGEQWMSWISLEDALGAILLLLRSEAIAGPVNMVSPNPVTNREFTRTLGRALSRPAVLPAPKFALRAALGQMADEALLSSARVRPRKLIEYEYLYKDPQLEDALRRMLTTKSA